MGPVDKNQRKRDNGIHMEHEIPSSDGLENHIMQMKRDHWQSNVIIVPESAEKSLRRFFFKLHNEH